MKYVLIIIATAFITGGGLYLWDHNRLPAPVQSIVPPAVTEPPTTPPATTDPYAGWQTVEESGVEFKLPPGYRMDAGAGNRYVVKIDANNPSPTPDMHISTDGQQLNFRRWENHAWQYWDQVIASIRVKTPMRHPLQINIDI